MPRVMVRVELHGATAEQYDQLRVQMASARFARIIAGADGESYALPTATYCSDSYDSANAACNAGWSAAAGITRSYGVVATQGSSVWRGLPKV
jgi:hypothetical protein